MKEFISRFTTSEQTALSVFEGLRLDLKYLMNWCVTSRPWMICKEYGESRNPNKSLFRNNLLRNNPKVAAKKVPNDISSCVVDGGRLIRIIGISDLTEKTFLSWAKNVCNYLRSLPGNTVHVVFDNYEEADNLVLTKGRRKKVDSKTSSSHRVGRISIYR